MLHGSNFSISIIEHIHTPVGLKAIWRASLRELQLAKNGANTNSTAISLIRMFGEGPEVSSSGSPCHLWLQLFEHLTLLDLMNFACSEAPASMYFLALSHAPPVLEAYMATWGEKKEKEKKKVEQTSRWNGDLDINFVHIWTPETSELARTPARVSTPNKVPAMSGVSITNAAGGIISLSYVSVEILTQAA